MKEFTAVMGLIDFIPVILFCSGSIILQRIMYDKMSKGQFALFAAGTVDVTMAGVCKALYKVLYGAHICDFTQLNNVFFPVQSFGFLLAGLGVLLMLLHKRDKFMTMAVAPVVFKGTFFFVTLMCLGLGFMNIGLSVQAMRDKKAKTIPFFIIAFFCCLCMGYLSSKNFDKAIYNWIAEGINTVGQACFLTAAILYKKEEVR